MLVVSILFLSVYYAAKNTFAPKMFVLFDSDITQTFAKIEL
mgnify:CR=1 FL=1